MVMHATSFPALSLPHIAAAASFLAFLRTSLSFVMGNMSSRVSFFERSTEPFTIESAMLSDSSLDFGMATTSASPSTLTALRVKSSGSPGPTPMPYNLPILFMISYLQNLLIRHRVTQIRYDSHRLMLCENHTKSV